MNFKSRYILVLEEQTKLNEMIRDYIKTILPDVTALPARTIAEANILLTRFEMSLLIVHLNLPDGNGFELVGDVKTAYPDIKVILISGDPIEDVQHLLHDLGSVRYVQKPFEMISFGELIKSMLSGGASPGKFAGSLRQLQLADLIQVKCFAMATTALLFTNPQNETGVIFFENGEIVHAKTSTLDGTDAFNAILKWQNGTFHEVDTHSKVDRTIFKKWEPLLMDAVRLADEHRTAQAG
ncbi:MAG: DUF4388 domain-containing protein [Candidatus Methylacidiphilales bacterium]|nr:DUF4388 domain-containing protein [Candidatus Methylacidiphilales bacterium]